MSVQWGVIWTAEDPEKVCTQGLKGPYKNREEADFEIGHFPHMLGRLVYRQIGEWRMAGERVYTDENSDRIKQAVRNVEQARLAVRDKA